MGMLKAEASRPKLSGRPTWATFSSWFADFCGDDGALDPVLDVGAGEGLQAESVRRRIPKPVNRRRIAHLRQDPRRSTKEHQAPCNEDLLAIYQHRGWPANFLHNE